jgi:hypothetical protein
MTNPEQPDTDATQAGKARRVTSPDGRQWAVHEYRSSRYDRRAGTSLVFVTEDAMRRVREYPDNWHELSDEELYALSFRR